MLSKSLRMAALNASLQAQCGERRSAEAQALFVAGQNELAADHPFLVDLKAFAQGHATADVPGDIYQLGKDLGRAIARHNQTDPVDAGRKDIYG